MFEELFQMVSSVQAFYIPAYLVQLLGH
jgi:hypothetical protein